MMNTTGPVGLRVVNLFFMNIGFLFLHTASSYNSVLRKISIPGVIELLFFVFKVFMDLLNGLEIYLGSS